MYYVLYVLYVLCMYVLGVQFRIAEFSDFLQTSYTYVFWRADYENERQGDFHGETMKKP